jgi:hypothetical protein
MYPSDVKMLTLGFYFIKDQALQYLINLITLYNEELQKIKSRNTIS